MAGASNIKAGGAFVEIFADKSPMVRGLKSARADFDSWAAGIRTAGLGMAGLSLGGGAFLGGAVKQFADAGGALDDINQRTGVSVEALSLLKHAATLGGSSLEALEGSLKKYAKTVTDAVANPTGEAAKAFDTLGISIDQLRSMPAEEQLQLIGERLKTIPVGAARASAAMGVFGKSGADMIPVLTALSENMDRAADLGLGWTTEEAQNAAELGDRFDDLSAVAKRTVQIIGSELAPTVMALTEPLLQAAVETRQWVSENPKLFQAIAFTTAGVGALGASLVAVGGSMAIASAAAGPLAGALRTVITTTAVFASPLNVVQSSLGSMPALLSKVGAGYSSLSKKITSVVTLGAFGVEEMADGTKKAGAKAKKASGRKKPTISAGPAVIKVPLTERIMAGVGRTVEKTQATGRSWRDAFKQGRERNRVGSIANIAGAKLGKAGTAVTKAVSGAGSLGVAAVKTAFGGMQATVTALTSSSGKLFTAIRGGANSAGGSVLKLGASFATALAPVLAVGAIAGIGYVIATQTDIGRAGMERLRESGEIALDAIGIAGGRLKEDLSQAWVAISGDAMAGYDQLIVGWDGVTDAIAAGDLGLAGEIAMAGLEAVWRTGAATLIDTWDVATSQIVSIWTDATAASMAVGEDLSAWFQTLWLDIKGFAFDAFDAINQKWDSASGAIADKLIDVGVATGVMEGDAEEIKQTRREDTSRRQQSSDQDVAKRADDIASQRAEIEASRQQGQAAIEKKRAADQRQILDDRDKALTDNEKKKIAAQEKLKELRNKAAEVKAEVDQKAKEQRDKDQQEDEGDGLRGKGSSSAATAGTFSGLVSSFNRGAAAIATATAQTPRAMPDLTKLRVPDVVPKSIKVEAATTEVMQREMIVELKAINAGVGKLISEVQHGGLLTP
jgi:hypothetical protein